jgi:hypothetical protein
MVSWESREKLDSKSALPYQYSFKGETKEESTNPFGYFRDRGSSPEETKQVYMNEYQEHECDLPWVYCYYTSDGARSASISGLTVTTFLAITVAHFIMY